MSSKIQEEERDHFSDRLKAALQAAGLDSSPSKFATAFNVRADGATVTVHGARKWLIGEAIPTQARIQIIADWLGISAAWLLFGEAQNAEVHTDDALTHKLDTPELVLVRDLRRLSQDNRMLVRDIVDSMLTRDSASHQGFNAPRSKQK